jgi:hypothetical protein
LAEKQQELASLKISIPLKRLLNLLPEVPQIIKAELKEAGLLEDFL